MFVKTRKARHNIKPVEIQLFYFDLAEGHESLAEAVQNVQARFLVASYDTDWLFPSSQSRELVSALLQTGKHVSFLELPCPFGHDSFLIDLDPLTDLVAPFLQQTQAAGRIRGTAADRV